MEGLADWGGGGGGAGAEEKEVVVEREELYAGVDAFCCEFGVAESAWKGGGRVRWKIVM